MTNLPSGLLGDTPERTYAHKLDLFTLHAERELRDLLQWLPIRVGDRVLDAGCGTGWITTWIADLTGPRGLTVGADLAGSHVARARLNAATAQSSSVFLQADLLSAPFRTRCFGGVWLGNTLNHLRVPVEAVTRLATLVRSGGWIALAQSHVLPEMIFAWDERLERAVTAACRRYYREKYNLREQDTTGVRRLVGIAHDAGLKNVAVKTVVIERTAPLAVRDEEYYRRVVLEGSWGLKVEPYLSEADRDQLRILLDSSGENYALRRNDFHAAETYTVAVGEVA